VRQPSAETPIHQRPRGASPLQTNNNHAQLGGHWPPKPGQKLIIGHSEISDVLATYIYQL